MEDAIILDPGQPTPIGCFETTGSWLRVDVALIFSQRLASSNLFANSSPEVNFLPRPRRQGLQPLLQHDCRRVLPSMLQKFLQQVHSSGRSQIFFFRKFTIL
jgi:hypothetical protein